jgi:hypothetical protein
MQYLLELLKILLPSVVVFLTAYYLIKNFLETQQKNKMLELQLSNKQTILPVRLQAYERVLLLLERISPENIVMRIRKPDMTAADLQVALVNEVRNEFDHNLSQQLYLSDDAWYMVKSAKEEVIRIINNAYGKMGENDKANQMSKTIFNDLMNVQKHPTEPAIQRLKQEAQQMF